MRIVVTILCVAANFFLASCSESKNDSTVQPNQAKANGTVVVVPLEPVRNMDPLPTRSGITLGMNIKPLNARALLEESAEKLQREYEREIIRHILGIDQASVLLRIWEDFESLPEKQRRQYYEECLSRAPLTAKIYSFDEFSQLDEATRAGVLARLVLAAAPQRK